MASKSAIESVNSAKAGSSESSGVSPKLDFPDSRKEEREDGRNGVVGRLFGLRVRDPDRFMLLSRGVVEDMARMLKGSGRANVMSILMRKQSRPCGECCRGRCSTRLGVALLSRAGSPR